MLSKYKWRWQKRHKYIIIYWILEVFIIIIQIIQKIYPEYFKLIKGNKEREFINLVCLVIVDFSAGFGYFCSCSISSNIIKKNNLKRCKLISSLIAISVLYFMSFSSFFLFYLVTETKETEGNDVLKNYQIDWLIGLDIILRHQISLYILKDKLYNHHKCSLKYITICFFFMLVSDTISIIFGNKNINICKLIFYIVFILYRPFCFSFADVLNKLIFKKYYYYPYFLMFIRGFFEIIFLIVLCIILLFIRKLQFIYIDDNLLIKILFICLNIIFLFIKALSLMKVINYFSANFVSILILAESFGGIINQITDFCFSEKYWYEIMNIIIDSICLIVLFISSLIYNEMLVDNEKLLTEEKINLGNEEEGLLVKLKDINNNNDNRESINPQEEKNPIN